MIFVVNRSCELTDFPENESVFEGHYPKMILFYMVLRGYEKAFKLLKKTMNPLKKQGSELCSKSCSLWRRREDLNLRAGITDLPVFEAGPFSHLGTPPYFAVLHGECDYNISARISSICIFISSDGYAL